MVNEKTIREAASILQRASKVISGNHWTQGVLYERVYAEDKLVDQYCALGGIRKATNELKLEPQAKNLAILTLRNSLLKNEQLDFYERRSIPDWNDSFKTKQEDVIKQMRKVARQLLSGIRSSEKKAKNKTDKTSQYFFKNAPKKIVGAKTA